MNWCLVDTWLSTQRALTGVVRSGALTAAEAARGAPGEAAGRAVRSEAGEQACTVAGLWASSWGSHSIVWGVGVDPPGLGSLHTRVFILS